MNSLYNKAFRLGFGVTLTVFTILNVVSYLDARSEYFAILKGLEGNKFSGIIDFPNWGFLFPWEGNSYSSWMFENGFLGLVLNFVTIVGIAFVIGFLTRFLAARMFSSQ